MRPACGWTCGPCILTLGLLNLVEAEVGTQALGHNDAVGGLIVLEEGGDDAWEGKGAAVEGVGETHLAVGVLETELHAVGLEGLEIGDR